MDIFLLVVILLFGLAITDLIVGVSNDAVNFLNSAIGSKVATRRTIMIVASLGIVVGATFSSGMMEVARKGIFNPQYFQFYDIMALFLAVMLTDIILLDLFNTFGMPTSTTVSIVFELLGAAVMVALIKSASAATPDSIATYINGSSALAIILGIFLSILVAFTIGALVMYLSRLIFTFQFHRRFNWVGAVWSGAALAAMTYFLLIKGMKGASFIPVSVNNWVQGNTWLLLFLSFGVWTAIMQILLSLFRVNILRLIVLFGTFSLAMAFAGNDLVNFIGVPVAGFESYNAWVASGEAPREYSMVALSRAYPTKTYLLLAAGLIMTLTLWFSKKAQSVTETEVNLGRQQEGLERFSPNWLAQYIVRGARGLATGVQGLVPAAWLSKAESSFEMPEEKTSDNSTEEPPPAFDLVRAAVNLTVASALIALATSYKLPLSTTYVSFMVAMGTSLSDRAWGRDSAVYRVAGVINVIGGWFATALIAFTVSAVFAFLIHRFQLWAIIVLVALAAFFITRTFLFHKKREKAKARREAARYATENVPAAKVIGDTAAGVARTLRSIRQAYHDSLDGLAREDLSQLRQTKKTVKDIHQQNQEFKYTFYSDIRRIEEHDGQGSRAYLLVYDLNQDIIQSIDFIVNACHKHVKNSHQPLSGKQQQSLRAIESRLDSYFNNIAAALEKYDFDGQTELLTQKQTLYTHLEKLLHEQITDVKQRKDSARNSLLYFSLLLETKDLVAVAARFGKLYYRLKHYSPEHPYTLVAGA